MVTDRADEVSTETLLAQLKAIAEMGLSPVYTVVKMKSRRELTEQDDLFIRLDVKPADAPAVAAALTCARQDKVLVTHNMCFSIRLRRGISLQLTQAVIEAVREIAPTAKVVHTAHEGCPGFPVPGGPAEEWRYSSPEQDEFSAVLVSSEE